MDTQKSLSICETMKSPISWWSIYLSLYSIVSINGSVSKIKFEAIKYHMSIEINWAFYSIRMNHTILQKQSLFIGKHALPFYLHRYRVRHLKWNRDQSVQTNVSLRFLMPHTLFLCIYFNFDYLFGFYRSHYFRVLDGILLRFFYVER